jgi:hypothetical protein
MSRWLAAIVMSAVVLAAVVPVAAQGDTTEPPCHSPEAAQFDFWLGEWNLTWRDSGKGTNKITKVLDGCVILENFDGAPSMQFRGWSVSSFDVATGEWKQTWVDNQGGYLDFTGGFADGKMTLSRETTIEGKPALQRMVFSNIGENDLDWNWEHSLDGGGTWEPRWLIHYRRR